MSAKFKHKIKHKEDSLADTEKFEKSTDSVRAVDRALDILQAFTAADFELSAGELLKRVDLSRPTLYRLLNTLEKSGFVTSSGEPQKFRLGSSVARLAHVWTSSLDISAVAQPFMQRIHQQTGETVSLFIQQADERVCIAELPSTQPLSFKRGVGYSERIVLGASGRVILAHMPDGDEKLRLHAAQAHLDSNTHAKDLILIRQRGYALSKDELIQGAVAVAAPYFDGSSRVVGSIAVFGPSARLHTVQTEAFGKLLIVEAKALSKALGYR